MNSGYRAVRLHILGCRAIAAAIEERIERARLAIASDLLAAESHARAERVLETMRDAPHVPATATVVQQIVADMVLSFDDAAPARRSAPPAD